jgi:DUF4097 and DUF4098 domain-containing protein YvlB
MAPVNHRFLISGDSPELKVSFPAGTLRIDASEDTDVIVVDVESKRPEHSEVRQVGDVVLVNYTKGSSRFIDSKAVISVSVPTSTRIKTKVASADVRVTDEVARISANSASGDVVIGVVRETCNVNIASGDISIDHVMGSCNTNSASGDVHVATVDGDLKANAASGDIRVGAAERTVVTRTASGDLSIDVAKGNVSAESASGDLTIGSFSGKQLEVKTVSGDSRISLPAGTRANIKARNLSGNVYLPDKPSDFEGERTNRDITFKSVSGDLHINVE